jgi:hypothetical protein
LLLEVPAKIFNAAEAFAKSLPLVEGPLLVIAGLVPVISIRKARRCHSDRDHRDKSGDDIG